MNLSLLLRKPRFIIVAFLIISLFLFVIPYHYQLRNLFSYGLRPLWDKEEGPKNLIPHYYSEGLGLSQEEICALHGWERRSSPQSHQVIDAVLMSSELDLLEIRMHELNSVVDWFFIIESDATFTGLPKDTYFRNNKERFKEFDSKIKYIFLPGGPLEPGEGAFDREFKTRQALSSHIHDHVNKLSTNARPLVIMSDLDEIPSEHTISLLKSCDFGDTIHLKLRNYLYSFEWYIGDASWRASVNLWRPGFYYRHSMAPKNLSGRENVLADSGWHCSFCFRTLQEYRLKMEGYSHSDRLGGDMKLLDLARIQRVICEGTDIFGMLPEAYTYGDLLTQMHPKPQYGAVHIPKYVIERHNRFNFLLPKGCQREDGTTMD